MRAHRRRSLLRCGVQAPRARGMNETFGLFPDKKIIHKISKSLHQGEYIHEKNPPKKSHYALPLILLHQLHTWVIWLHTHAKMYYFYIIIILFAGKFY